MEEKLKIIEKKCSKFESHAILDAKSDANECTLILKQKFNPDVPVSQEKRLSPPLDGDALADRDVVEVDLDLGHGQNVLRCGHAEKN
jgi:hypothetical protein